MNFTFFVLIAIPLGVYLLVILFQTREIGADEIQAEPSSSIIVPPHESALDDILAPAVTKEPLSPTESEPELEGTVTEAVVVPASPILAETPATSTETPATTAAQPEVAPPPPGETIQTAQVAETESASPVGGTVETAPIAQTEVASFSDETIATTPVAETGVASPAAETVEAALMAQTEIASPSGKTVELAPIAKTQVAALVHEIIEAAPIAETEVESTTGESIESAPVSQTEVASLTDEIIEAPPVAQTKSASAPAETVETPPVAETEVASPTAETSASVEREAPLSIEPAANSAAPNGGSPGAAPTPAEVSGSKAPEEDEPDPILPTGPLHLPSEGSPRYAFDYRGRLWVEKKRKGFFRQLRRPQLPPEDPPNNSGR